MMELLVIADDFTGALDTGVQFARRGIDTRVVCGRAYDSLPDTGTARVLCLDAQTRHLSPERAYQAVYEIALEAYRAGVPVIFKKVDSTLRGQIGSELAGVLDAAGNEPLAFVPAFPAAGRTTAGGVHLLDGLPLDQTVFASDPFEPIMRADIAGIVGAHCPAAVVHVPVRGRPPQEDAKRVEVYDAATEADMRAIATLLLGLKRRLLGGSAGLARALADCMAPEGQAAGAPQVKPGMLVVCGSLNPISDRQIENAKANGFLCMEIPAAYIWAPRAKAQETGFVDEICRLSRSGARVLLTTPRQAPQRNAGCVARDRAQIARRIGEMIRAWYDRGCDHALVVTGGDTLHAFLECLGPGVSLTPLCELEPGVVVSRMRAGDGRLLQIVSKAGGFGGEDVYTNIARRVLAEKPGAPYKEAL